MTKYDSNEQYERDKAALIHIANGTHIINFIENADVIANLLKQSKWIGNVDDVVDNSASVKPIPVKKDGNGLAIKDYEVKDWFAKLNEELDEVKSAAFFDLYDSTREDIAEELQDLITICTSYLDFLGFDEAARVKLCQQVNDKNRKRGYFEE